MCLIKSCQDSKGFFSLEKLDTIVANFKGTKENASDAVYAPWRKNTRGTAGKVLLFKLFYLSKLLHFYIR